MLDGERHSLQGSSMIEEMPDDRLQIVEEQLHVDKRVVETDRVRVRTVTDERTVTLEADVERGVLDVERIAVDREVDVAPPPREDGDVLVISGVEERAEIVTRLFVVEELRIRRTSVTEAIALPTTLRTMRAVVERDEALSNNGAG
jgi:uncharacterized protein (TIGR02271 family)